MKTIIFLIPDGSLKPSSLFASIEVFEKANEYYTNKGESEFYDIKIAGVDPSQNLLNSRLFIRSTMDITSVINPDLIIIPGLNEKNDYSGDTNRDLINWVVKHYKDGCEIASLCTGTFFLAVTGLLKGRECSTHWRAQDTFTTMFPDVILLTDKIITDSKGIYTAGGANSSLNLILYLIEKFNGREAALYCAKVLQIDISRNSQAPFILFEGQKNHSDQDIKEVQLYIEKNIDKKVSVEALADQFNMSRRNFVRRFKTATKNTPIEYIQRIKMEAAKRNFEMSRKNINEVMDAVGYTDTKAFRTTFRKVTGLTPLDYKTKFSKT
ncbi:MAG: helix-turn-helix domain-containing protein [Ginsengibacter sp.]